MRYFRDVETDSLCWDASTDLVWLKDGAHGIALGELESCLDCPEHLRVELRELKVAVWEELYGSAWTAAPKPIDLAAADDRRMRPMEDDR